MTRQPGEQGSDQTDAHNEANDGAVRLPNPLPRWLSPLWIVTTATSLLALDYALSSGRIVEPACAVAVVTLTARGQSGRSELVSGLVLPSAIAAGLTGWIVSFLFYSVATTPALAFFASLTAGLRTTLAGPALALMCLPMIVASRRVRSLPCEESRDVILAVTGGWTLLALPTVALLRPANHPATLGMYAASVGFGLLTAFGGSHRYLVRRRLLAAVQRGELKSFRLASPQGNETESLTLLVRSTSNLVAEPMDQVLIQHSRSTPLENELRLGLVSQRPPINETLLGLVDLYLTPTLRTRSPANPGDSLPANKGQPLAFGFTATCMVASLFFVLRGVT